MGSVSPLIAIRSYLEKKEKNDYLWIGTQTGPERLLVEKNGLAYKAIFSGKWRRYFDWRNFSDPFLMILGLIQSLWQVWRFKPDVLLTAGSFVCVPVALAARIFKVKIIVHQQDLKIGLANRLMQKIATKITIAFPELQNKFPREKVVLTGNPVRPELFAGSREQAMSIFHLETNLPTLLIMGGGIGSEVINKGFISAQLELTRFCQVIHLLGKGDQAKWLHQPEVLANHRYHVYEFLAEELTHAYAAADLVFGRAGLSSLTELAALKKASIIMPIPDNQQEVNAEYLFAKKAIVYVKQEDFSADYIVSMIDDLFNHGGRLVELGENLYRAMPQNAGEEYAKMIDELVRPLG